MPLAEAVERAALVATFLWARAATQPTPAEAAMVVLVSRRQSLELLSPEEAEEEALTSTPWAELEPQPLAAALEALGIARLVRQVQLIRAEVAAALQVSAVPETTVALAFGLSATRSNQP